MTPHRSPVRSPDRHVPCPYCCELILPDARRCGYCRSSLVAMPQAAARPRVAYFNKATLLVAPIIGALLGALVPSMSNSSRAASGALGSIGQLALGWFLFVSLVTLVTFIADKATAIFSWSRVPENTLLWMVALGGTAGAFVGMWFVRHKTSKGPFLARFFAVAGLQLAAFLSAGLLSHQTWGIT